MAIQNEEVNVLIKQKHDLIRKLEKKKITEREFNEQKESCDEQIKQQAINKVYSEIKEDPTGIKFDIKEKEKEPKPLKKPKKKRAGISSSIAIYILDNLCENKYNKKEFIEFIAKDRGVKLHTVTTYLIETLDKIRTNQIKGYFFDKDSFKIYKKCDLIDESGNPIP